MSGYIEAGYAVILGTLGVYGTTLALRERAARRRTTLLDRPPEQGPDQGGPGQQGLGQQGLGQQGASDRQGGQQGPGVGAHR